MDEYIGKGALYDALWDAKEEKKVKSLKDVFDFLDKFPAEDGVIIPQWISVKDRLPEDKQNVLTIDSESKTEVCFYEKEWKGVFQQCGGLVKIFNITHWLPLPEPPKAEQKLKEMRGVNDA